MRAAEFGASPDLRLAVFGALRRIAPDCAKSLRLPFSPGRAEIARMKKRTWFSSAILLATLVAFGAASTGCAYILYPERRNTNRTGGRIDTVPLVVDILLFLPGLVPGAVALAIDFTTGAIYTTGGGSALAAGGEVAVKLPPSDKPVQASVAVVNGAGQVLDRDQAFLPAGDVTTELVVDVRRALRAAHAMGASTMGLHLEVSGMTDTPARIELATE